MTVQQMAESIIGIGTEDELSLDRWGQAELEAFEAYVSSYAIVRRMVCKGCHGG